MRQPLDPQLLETFLAVLQHGRISAAARAVHLSQPAVTARMRKLEETVGAPLLVRSVRGVTPTPAGERLAARARELQRLLDEIAGEVAVDDDAALGPLHVAASTTIAAHVLPRVLARFRARHPDLPIELRVGNTEEVVDAVRSGAFPLGLVEGTKRAAGVKLSTWVDDQLLPVVGATADWRVRSVRDLENVPILWREQGSGTRAVVAKALRAAGVRHTPGDRDAVLGTSSAIAGAVAAGMGIAFLSRWALGAEFASGRLVPLAGLDLRIVRTFQWALPAGALTGTAASFHDFATRNPPSPST
ncbi:MAG: LysR family transcriptional regulator [Planctomycetota bacterium]